VTTPGILVFVDTCSLLDPARKFIRDSDAGEIAAAVSLLTFAKAHVMTIGFAVTSLTDEEFANSRAGAEDLVFDLTRKFEQLYSAVLQHSSLVSLSNLSPLPASWTPAGLMKDSFAFVDVLHQAAAVEPISTADIFRADKRVKDARAPSRKGKESFSDCKNAECVLRVASTRPPDATVFLSSNTSDFGEAAKASSPLATEFAEAGLAYSTSWKHLQQRLRGAPFSLQIP
jgi:hypothetical protein